MIAPNTQDAQEQYYFTAHLRHKPHSASTRPSASVIRVTSNGLYQASVGAVS